MLDVTGFETIGSTLKYFEEISAVPRISGNTKGIADYLSDFASSRGLEYVRDQSDNIIIKKPASAGFENRPTVILQGHTDMVAAGSAEAIAKMKKNGVTLIREGDVLRADGTTLGGDNGIAVAYMLAILDDVDISHPELECVFTSNEETGLYGATALDGSLLSGKIMINIDSDLEGVITAGCAGGIRVAVCQSIKRGDASGNCYKLSISGFLGGHSGIDIDKDRANAIKAIAACLDNLGEIRILSLEGGTASNAIPAHASCTFYSEKSIDALKSIAERVFEEYKAKESAARLELDKIEVGGRPLEVDSSNKILSLIRYEPSGVVAMSSDVEGLVETSINMGLAKLDEEFFNLTLSIRSSLEESKFAVLMEVDRIAWDHRATLTTSGDYTGWAFKKESHVRDICRSEYERLFGKSAEVNIIHAGLECGIFASKIEGLDCISIGPDNMDIHTSEERLSLPSVARVYELILAMLKKI